MLCNRLNVSVNPSTPSSLLISTMSSSLAEIAFGRIDLEGFHECSWRCSTPPWLRNVHQKLLNSVLPLTKCISKHPPQHWNEVTNFILLPRIVGVLPFSFLFNFKLWNANVPLHEKVSAHTNGRVAGQFWRKMKTWACVRSWEWMKLLNVFVGLKNFPTVDLNALLMPITYLKFLRELKNYPWMRVRRWIKFNGLPRNQWTGTHFWLNLKETCRPTATLNVQ